MNPPRTVAELSGRYVGQFVVPGDAQYDDLRKVHNGLVDKRPAVIARCRSIDDIVHAVQVARDYQLEVAVRGGGHNVAGRATVDGGLMIDLSTLKGILVDPNRRRVRADGGLTWNDFNRATQPHGLACTGGVVSTTGIGGLTLGGGLGWLHGKYGLALDNLLSAEIVTANGEMLRASADENADLFWGIRGGGGNFGIAASLEYRLYSVGPTITGGLVAHPFSAARDVLRFYRDATSRVGDELTVFAGLIHSPDGAARLAALVACHCDSQNDAAVAVRPFKQFGTPVMDVLEPMSYCDLNTMLDGAYPKGALNYWKSSFLSQLSDDAIDTMVECYSRCPSPMSGLLVEHFHGAVTRVPVADTAFPHRAPGYNFLILTQWMDPADTEKCIAWARETYAAMQPFMAARRYVNYLGDDEAADALTAAYGPNYSRLRELKNKYDPDNFFHLNQNIRA